MHAQSAPGHEDGQENASLEVNRTSFPSIQVLHLYNTRISLQAPIWDFWPGSMLSLARTCALADLKAAKAAGL